MPHHTKKCVVGLKNAAVVIPNENPDDGSVHQAPNLRFAFREIAIKPRILERDCCLRRKHFQYGYPAGIENVWRKVVFKVENPDELALSNQWQTENGAGPTTSDVRICRKRTLR